MKFKNMAWKLSGLVLGGGALFVFQIMIMRYLGPESFGHWAFAISCAGLFAVFIDFGFNPLISRDLAQWPHRGIDYWNAISHFKGVLTVAAFVLMILVSRFYDPIGRNLVLTLGALGYMAACSWAETFQSFTHGFEAFRPGTLMSISFKGLAVLAGLYAIFSGFSAVTVMLFLAGGAILGASVNAWIIRHSVIPRLLRSSETFHTRSAWMQALPLFVQNALIFIYFRVDTALLMHYSSARETGIYNGAYRFFELSSVIPTALLAAHVATLSRETKNGLSNFFLMKYIRLFGSVALGGMVLLWIGSYAISLDLLGSQYRTSAQLLLCLSPTLLFLYVNYFLTTLLVLIKKSYANAWIAAAAAILNITSNALSIPRWGAYGAVWSTLATEVCITVLSLATIMTFVRSQKY